MKKYIVFAFFLIISFLAKSQVTPAQIDACKGVASGQNSYSVTINCNSFPTSTYQMQKICVTYTITNTGASTLKVNNQSAVAITLGGSSLSSGDIVANQPTIMIYDNIGSKWVMIKSGGGGSGGGVSSVTASLPLSSSGGSTPDIGFISNQGDMFYGSGTNTVVPLAKNTSATRYISNTGTSNNPSWSQVNLVNGVTGSLPVANGGTNSTLGSWNYNGNTVVSEKSIGTVDSFAIPFVTNNTEKMRLTAAGLVGIGTATPTATMELKGATSTSVTPTLKLTNSTDMHILTARNDRNVLAYNLQVGNSVSSTDSASVFGIKLIGDDAVSGELRVFTTTGNELGSFGVSNASSGLIQLKKVSPPGNIPALNTQFSSETNVINFLYNNGGLDIGSVNTAANTGLGNGTQLRLNSSNLGGDEDIFMISRGGTDVGSIGQNASGNYVFYLRTVAAQGSMQIGVLNFKSAVTIDEFGDFAINGTQTSVNNSVSGDTKFTQPISGTTYKTVIITCTAALGSASYTFPVPFTVTPSIIQTNDIATAIITALSTTAVTVTGTASTGSIMLIGY